MKPTEKQKEICNAIIRKVNALCPFFKGGVGYLPDICR